MNYFVAPSFQKKTYENIIMVVEEVFGMSIARIINTRQADVIEARISISSLIIYCRNTNSLYDYISFKDIAAIFHKDHSTITHYIKNAYWFIKGDKSLQHKLSICCTRLNINYDNFVTYLFQYQKLNPKEKNKIHKNGSKI